MVRRGLLFHYHGFKSLAFTYYLSITALLPFDDCDLCCSPCFTLRELALSNEVTIVFIASVAECKYTLNLATIKHLSIVVRVADDKLHGA